MTFVKMRKLTDGEIAITRENDLRALNESGKSRTASIRIIIKWVELRGDVRTSVLYRS